MNTIQKVILGVIALATIVIGAATFGQKSLSDATVSNYPTWYYNGIVVGPANSLISNIIIGSCNISGTATTTTFATTTGTCTVTGANVGDKVQVTQSSQGTSVFPVVSAFISSANTLSVTLQNSATTTQTPNGGSINGLYYDIFR